MLLSRVLSPILVGRDSELSTLEDAILSALRGDGGVVIVGGEAGMGKTRLVNTLAGPSPWDEEGLRALLVRATESCRPCGKVAPSQNVLSASFQRPRSGAQA